MFFLCKIFGLYVLFSLYFSVNSVLGDTDISLIIADDEFLHENVCYSVINEQPCVKKVLREMLHLVNKNSHQIKEIRKSLEKTEETSKLLISKLEHGEQHISELENKIKDISKKNMRLKRKVQKLELNGHLYYVPVKRSNKSDGFNEKDINYEIDDTTLVRY